MILRSPSSAGRRPPRPGLAASCLLLVELCWLGLGFLSPVNGSPCSAVCSCLGSFVDCSYRSLTKIPDDLPVWTEVLHLQHNFIANITHESLRSLTSLEELDMGNNLITNTKEFMAELPPNIKKLKLNNNRILEFDLSVNLTRLVQLSLKSNNIYQIRHLHMANSLDFLDLSDNQLKNLGSSAENYTSWPSSLTKLRLNHNRIATISKETFKSLNGLQTLDLSANAVQEVEGLAFHGLSSLTLLNLEGNSIRNLNDGAFWGLAGLKTLGLQNNAIAAVRKGWLYGLDTLQQLNLTNNNVDKIEDGCWEYTKDLQNLDLSANNLTTIARGTFAKAGNILTLDLSRNQIIHMADDALKQLRRLQTLDVSENQIGHILESTTSVFGWLKALQKLRLSRIGAVMLSGHAFGGLKQLRELDLSLNEVSVVEPDAFRELVSLQKLVLNSTSFVCDCEMTGFLHLVQTKSYTDAYFKCAFPPELQGKELKSLTPSQLKCYDKPRPKIETEPQSRVVVVGTNVTLACGVSFASDSSAAIRWKKDDTPIISPQVLTETTVKANVTTVMSTLVLVDIDRSYSGSYQCVASNHFGSVFSAKAKIAVHVFPTFVKHPQNVNVRIGSTARLECSATGNPRPQVRWKKNGGTDFPAARQRRIRYETGSDVMHIVNATREDAGVYACIAENAAGAAVVNATLIVTDSAGSLGADPFKTTRNAGETALFECPMQAKWKRVQWLKNGAMLLPTNRHFVLSDGQLLVISEITDADSGIYQCESSATGDMGSAYTLRVAKKSTGWLDFDDKTTWIWILVVVVFSCVVVTSLVWLMCIYHTRRKIRSGGSSTGTDETILPDECNPINGLHRSDDSSLDSPMAEYNEYLAVESEYSADGDYGAGKSQSHRKPYHESFSSESPSFANYLTLKATRTNQGYAPSPHRSCNTLPRVLR